MRIDAVILAARDGEALVRFYRDALGLPLAAEQHGPHQHWGCDLDGLHFAIHAEPDAAVGAGRTAVSFAVEDVDAAFERLRRAGAPAVEEPCTRPFGRLAAVRDPAGNTVYLHRY